MKVTLDLPEDPALPALEAIRSVGLSAAIPDLGLGGGRIDLVVRGYTPGSRATLEARTGNRHMAIKAYAKDPSREAALYRALSEAGLTEGSGVQVPQLLALDRNLRVLAISWLEGLPVNDLIKGGQGERAGILAAGYLRRAASLPTELGEAFDAGKLLFEVGKWVAKLVVSDPILGLAADMVANRLLNHLPHDEKPYFIHGALYARHIFDVHDGTGVIDWQRFGHGPLEVDAGTFLATISRIALRHEGAAREAARAEESFRAGTAGLLDARELAWHRGVSLLRFASKPVGQGESERAMAPDEAVQGREEARSLIREAARYAEAIA